MRINFIGCGKLGKTLAKLLHANKLAELNGIVNSSLASAVAAVKFIGAGTAYNSIDELPPADLHFITTSDDTIAAACNKLVPENILKAGNIVIHCSGSLSSEILAAAKNIGCHTASIHPIKSFASPEESVNSFFGTYCAIEGDEDAIAVVQALFEKMGAVVICVNKENKNLYHTAAVLANNYLVTLHYQAVQCYKESGIDEATAKKITSMLMSNSLNNLNNLTHQNTLTGPIQRGDTQTVKNHLEALKSNRFIRQIYSWLGLGTLQLTKHSDDKKEEFVKLFEVASSSAVTPTASTKMFVHHKLG